MTRKISLSIAGVLVATLLVGGTLEVLAQRGGRGGGGRGGGGRGGGGMSRAAAAGHGRLAECARARDRASADRPPVRLAAVTSVAQAGSVAWEELVAWVELVEWAQLVALGPLVALGDRSAGRVRSLGTGNINNRT